MTRFRFRSTWLIDAAVEEVFDALHDYQRWPEWWPGAEHMEELEPPTNGSTGGRGLYVWRSAAGYRVRFEGSSSCVRRPWALSGTVEGDLFGTGTWQLFAQPDGPTAAVYSWDVRVSRRGPAMLARALRPVLGAYHDRLMRDGAAGLARHLDTRVVADE